jgi:hypothetical protein
VPGRLIFYVIKIGRSARAGKAIAMENAWPLDELKYRTVARTENPEKQLTVVVVVVQRSKVLLADKFTFSCVRSTGVP